MYIAENQQFLFIVTIGLIAIVLTLILLEGTLRNIALAFAVVGTLLAILFRNNIVYDFFLGFIVGTIIGVVYLGIFSK